GRRIPARGPAPLTEAEYRRVLSRDGVVFDVGNEPDAGIATLPQVRLRLVPRDLTEITNRDYEMAEAMTGALGEGGNSFGTTNTHATSANFGVNLALAIAAAAPGTPLHLAAQVA